MSDTKNSSHGLSTVEATQRLQQYGYNELPTSRQKTILNLLLDIFKEPIFLLLIICAIIYFIIGSKHDALMLSSFVILIAVVTSYQEHKSERAVLALKNLASPRAFVIRDGIGKRIAGREVVVGDLIVLHEGDCVPADAQLISCENLSLDESILTGESFPVRKNLSVWQDKICSPGGDDLPFVYSGTYVVQGSGVAQVIATGLNTEMGKIGRNLAAIKSERSLLQQETATLVRYFAIWGFALCVLIALFYGFTRGNWLNGFLVGITLAMAILPEEFPVVLTIFLALGAWRISLKHVLTRHVPAIETLGAATVLCVDKTGTITQNQMAVAQLFAIDENYSVNPNTSALPEKFHQLVEYSILASQRDPFDPMEKAIKKVGEKYLYDTEHIHNDWELVHQYPLSKKILAISLVWKSLKSSDYVVAAKGAPEAIFDLCHLDYATVAKLTKQAHDMANSGLRILGVAKATFKKHDLPDGQHDFNFEFLGFIGLEDPVRSSVFAAVQNCNTAGIRVVMITGDYAGTAQKVAREIGLLGSEHVITGSELNGMNDLELEQQIRQVNIFARIMPDQKLRIVNALKANGEVVAMTGDGVNDAPALKAANIGIAMGGRGTDVAREAAKLVLLDDDFSSIVAAVKLGRRIFDNIKKAVAYLLAAHLPIIGLTVIPILFGWPLILLPIHVVFLELIIDPACSIVFEAESEEPDIMLRKPRSTAVRLFDKHTVIYAVTQGLGILAIILGVFLLGKKLEYSENIIRAMIFIVLVVSNLLLIVANRSWQVSWKTVISKPNPALWWVIGIAFGLLVSVLFIPFLRDLFYFHSLTLNQALFCILFGIGCVGYLEALKLLIGVRP